MSRNIWRLILFAGPGLLLLFALSIALQRNLPRPTGPYSVGRSTLRWLDPSRPEPLSSNSDDSRAIVAEIWYPAEAGTGIDAGYISDFARLRQSFVASGEVSRLESLGLRFVRSASRLNARPAHTEPGYPVVLLSPGNGTNVEFYAAIAEELASHGYIVVGVNHPYDVAAVTLADGAVARFAAGPSGGEEREEWVAGRIAQRVADVRFAVDQLEKINIQEDSPFAKRLDLTRLGVMGHSLGGITAAEACRTDARFQACLNFDGIQRGGPFSVDEDAAPPDQPFMMITKERDLHERLAAQFEAIPAGSYRVVINGAAHDSFTDGPLLQPSLLPVPNEADRILALNRMYTLAFFDQVLKDRPNNLLLEPLQSEDVSVEVYSPY